MADAHDAMRTIARKTLIDSGPLPASKLAAELFSLRRPPSTAVADGLLRGVLAGDSRFVRLSDDIWTFEVPERSPLQDATYAVVDVETTGARPPDDRITEIGIVRVEQGQIVKEFETLVNPERHIPATVTRITGITNEMVSNQPSTLEVMPIVADMLEGATFVAHSVPFDARFVDPQLEEATGEKLTPKRLCTLRLARWLYPDLRKKNLGNLCRHLGIHSKGLHRAGEDARVTTQVLLKELDDLAGLGITDWNTLQTKIPPVRRRSMREPLVYESLEEEG
jgi:DNA polymerase-3 subunit epsilon